MLKGRYRKKRTALMDMTPLIDMIFILLIFFIVTTSFVKESGVEIERPHAESSEKKEQVNLIIGVDAENLIWIEGKSVDIRHLPDFLENFKAKTVNPNIIIAADKNAKSGTLVQVLDLCTLADLENISVSTRKK